jgi:hypothetical protein
VKGDGDTTPGFRHPTRRSSTTRFSQLKLSTSTFAELHRDMRSMRSEFSARQEAARGAIYSLQSAVDRLQAAVEGLRTCQDHAFKLLLDQKRKDRLAIGVIGLAILIVLLLRMYRQIGV